MINPEIDNGSAFDFGKTSRDYAKYRDIYPKQFYSLLINRGLCIKGQNILDVGTGTGVLPRNLYKYGGKFTATDISQNQILEASLLSDMAGMDIEYAVKASEELDYPDESFDVITACQCFVYFRHDIFAANAQRILKDNGKLCILYMGWLPDEDKIADASEKLILKYNPDWTGYGDKRKEISLPDVYKDYFDVDESFIMDMNVPFTRESWNGRIKSCRGIGAALSDFEINEFEKEHMSMLRNIAPESFEIKHYTAVCILDKKKSTL